MFFAITEEARDLIGLKFSIVKRLSRSFFKILTYERYTPVLFIQFSNRRTQILSSMYLI